MKKPKAAAMGKPSTDQPEEEYKPTPREQEAIKAFVASREARKLSSRLTVKKAASGAFTIGFDHEDPFTGQILQQDSAERALNKLARTFTTQIEALKRYRSTGQQKVTVEHVTVQAGGQAIVGNVPMARLRVSPLNRHPVRCQRSRRQTKRHCRYREGVGCIKKRCGQPHETAVFL